MMKNSSELSSKLPSTSTFSFIAPFPSSTECSSASSTPLKQRRVSLALPDSPRLFSAWKFRDDTGLGVHSSSSESSSLAPEKRGKMRRIDDNNDRLQDEEPPLPAPEKKPRKKWTMEETQMLVNGCNKWGVGNWKSILNDPEFKFDNRSPVDLKDRFRTYFPDAYKQHYPNAKTHLSSKIRSALPDGTSIFEKTRSKKRRPFTEEEDRALKAGYDKHGTVWATIVKDPIFQEQNRRSTDLRDRFRNAFPDLYQAAGYKPRNSAKKKGQVPQPVRAATDDQIASSGATGPVRRTRRHTTQGLFRGGTKSVPESATCSEDEDSSDGEEELSRTILKQTSPPAEVTAASASASASTPEPFANEMDIQTADPLGEFLSNPDVIPSSSLSELTDSSQSQTWSSSLDRPPNPGTWSSTTNAASPTSSHISSDYFLSHSPFHRRNDGFPTMIGKSAWGPQDWLSPNPRLDPSAASSCSSSFAGGASPAPSSPFSFAHLNHGVLDRYDLFPPSLAHDFASEVGIGDTHSTFSDPDMFTPSSFRGFTHHSDYAGDLIFGARTHQPPQPFDYGPGFGFGSAGLGLSGLQSPSVGGLHPMQLHTPALPGIDEIELTSITLNDQVDIHDPMEETVDTAVPKDDQDCAMSLADISAFSFPQQTLDDIVGLTHELTPPGTPQTTALRPFRQQSNMTAAHNRSVSVPPSEHRTAVPRAAQTQLLKSRPLHTSPRSLSLMDLLPLQPNNPAAPHEQTYQNTIPFSMDSWRQQGDMYDLPFLDLHYYTNNVVSTTDAMDAGPSTAFSRTSADIARQGQALDLAETFATASRLGLPPSLTQHIPMMSQSANSTPPAMGRMMPMHHRGQSSVSPQDLLLRKGNENKRKRSSWDGVH
ncbi:uncharacterized protein LAESUDRAFT_732459 [Laetiporus sulphureus 93-53]|uniref:Myb-like domain-containing protein n=1 Tax=Laetiporus sulphureus 93-53 TaxID=1314785 RepID=A0A165B4V5_9APHY|nr:uncharacterized protein LAESUDRAFT_732459 [Laetiporus sulphureus 93-53]KZT00243.1 hypothetical protein LAESUDRAFT_732459 [Laetiporus sulphureus 93-53]